jgi:hypothetical protein
MQGKTIDSAVAIGAPMATNSTGMIHKDFRMNWCLLGGLEGSLLADILPGVACVKDCVWHINEWL